MIQSATKIRARVVSGEGATEIREDARPDRGRSPRKVRIHLRGKTVHRISKANLIYIQETGAVLRGEEIGQAFQFGKETAVRNILEPNWWESGEHQREQQVVVEEALRIDEERRRREEEGEEDDVVMPKLEDKPKATQAKKANGTVGEKPKVIARTRVSIDRMGKDCGTDAKQLQFTNHEIDQFKSMGMAPRMLDPLRMVEELIPRRN